MFIKHGNDDSDNLDPGVLLGGPCGDNATWSLQYGILTLEGTGKVEGWYTLHDWFTGELIEKRESPWKDYSSGIKEVHVGDGITGLGQFMFGNLPNLKKAVFADSVKVIDNTIFANDKLLTDIILGNGLKIAIYRLLNLMEHSRPKYNSATSAFCWTVANYEPFTRPQCQAL